MQDILEFIIKNITTNPDDVQIATEIDAEGSTNYLITVNPEDVGRIIGKEGKVIKAIRTIMRVIAIQKGVHVRVSVVSDQVSPKSTEEMPMTEEVQEAAPVAEKEPIMEDDGSITVEV